MNVNYTSETLARIAQQRLQAIEAEMQELLDKREALHKEHGALYAMLMGLEPDRGRRSPRLASEGDRRAF